VKTMAVVVSPAGTLFVHLPCGGTMWWGDPPNEYEGAEHAVAALQPACDVCGVRDMEWYRVHVEK
jgi:hypothetical protein